METQVKDKVSAQPPEFDKVLEKISEIVEKSDGDDYIYRGENEQYKKVCSGLYRARPNTDGVNFNIADFQKEALEEARGYTGDKRSDIEILTELQHFGGKTNLIDFTEDILIALFFACDGSPDKDGRVIFLKRESDDCKYKIRHPNSAIDRVKSQKSIFVASPEGFVTPDNEVLIPAGLKRDILDYLRKFHKISLKSICNDLHGFIRRSVYGEHLNGLEAQHNANEAKTPEDKKQYHKKAIKHYTEAIELDPKWVKAYNNRAVSYRRIRDFDAALKDCNEAMKLDPEFVFPYIVRGLIYDDKGDFNTAIEKYNEAIALEPDYAISYNNRGITYCKKGDFDVGIKNFDKAIELMSDFAQAYNNRGNAYYEKRDFDNAIENYDKTIELNPEYANAYSNRGLAWLHLSEWEKAKADLTTAKDMGIDIGASFQNDYESVEDFEAKNKVKVPEDIAALFQGK